MDILKQKLTLQFSYYNYKRCSDPMQAGAWDDGTAHFPQKEDHWNKAKP